MTLGRTDLLEKRKGSGPKLKVRGYVARKPEKNHLVVCIFTPEGGKTYYIADLGEARDVIAGRMGYCKLKGS